jgi:hypothetical protein
MVCGVLQAANRRWEEIGLSFDETSIFSEGRLAMFFVEQASVTSGMKYLLFSGAWFSPQPAVRPLWPIREEPR